MESIIHKIKETAQINPNKVALEIEEDGEWRQFKYQDLMKQLDDVTSLLKKRGVSAGDRLVLMSENRLENVIAYLAILACEATAVNIDSNLPLEDLYSLIDQADPRAILASKKTGGHFTPERLPYLPVWDITRSYIPLANFQTNISKKREVRIAGDPEVATILFTSGTTGHYQGVMLSHDNLISAIKESAYMAELTPNDKVLCLFPMHHVFPLVQFILTPLYYGSQIILVSKLDEKSLFSAFKKKPTKMIVVPKILEMLHKKIKGEIQRNGSVVQGLISFLQKFSDLVEKTTSLNIRRHLMKPLQRKFGGKLSLIVCGGAPLSRKVHEDMEKWGFIIRQGYGLTETSGAAAFSNPWLTQVYDSVGVCSNHMEMRIHSPNENGEGEICLRGKGLMKGYFGDPEATQQAIRDGWFHTGDLGKIDENGYLFITGRKRELIVLPSGKKAMPHTVEAHYHDIDGIKDLAVVGMELKGEQTGEMVCATVVIDDEKQLEEEKIELAFFERASTLPDHFRIEKIFFVNEIPRTTSLKVKRHLLKKKLMEA